MDIIDFHVHIYPDKIAERAVESVGDFYNLKMNGNGTAETVLQCDKNIGVTNCVVHSVAVSASRVETINDYIASECEKHKEFYGFGTMHADYDNKIEETNRFLKLGLKGVKIHPDTQLFNMDDERMFELYDFLQQTKTPILIHTGDYRYDYSHPRRLKNLLKQFPDLIAIGAHFGGWSVFDLAIEYLKDEKCYLDTSSSFPMIGLKRAKELIRLYGAERIVYGTDFPMWNPQKSLEDFMSLNLTDDENELILNKNAKKILKLEK
ncbi:MAG: amidohydrolase family protein [Clostridia bacterium]|nr:amidohydrolase family protein [Clostridia bacterium]